jgi:cell division protein FtsI/penicillin-binding protein 2
VFLSLFAFAGLIIVARLTELQLVYADHFRERAERSLRTRPSTLPFVRGRILDRTGKVLVREEPCWDIRIDYTWLSADVGDDPSRRSRQIKRWRRTRHLSDAVTDAETERLYAAEVEMMWRDLASFVPGGSTDAVEAFQRHALDIIDHVQGVRRAVARRRGFDAPVAEERVPHTIVTGLGAEQQITARETLARYPWVHVVPASERRIVGDAVPLAHVLGRTGSVNATHVADDPNADDPFAKYRADETVGISGVELAAEALLRGRRGQIMKDRSGRLIVDECIDAEDGRDASITLHAGLQRRLYDSVGRIVEQISESSGGAVVVLDIPTREVLALVSYPAFDPTRFDELYPVLRDDTRRWPLRFRAVANRYPPGSTIKPLVCLAGLMSGRITLDTRYECTGYLLPEHRDRWRCWQIHGTNRRSAHGNVNVVEGLTGSCNVFMYHLGELLGVDYLCSVFDMVGIGRSTGIGLPEEARGINPTPGWLMQHKNARVTPGTARLFAIGQGELSMTPVQVANLMATYASGTYRPLTLIRNQAKTPEWIIPATLRQWAAIRQGIFNVVNDPRGTAYKYARFDHDRYVLCGKTGSATAHRWPTAYNVPYTDDDGAEKSALIHVGTKREAIRRFSLDHPSATFDPTAVEVAARWPPDPAPGGDRYSHAWFAGFLQEHDGTGRPVWSVNPRIAFAVLVEFGGSGSRTSGAIAKQIAADLLEVFGPDLEGGALAAPGES